MRKTALLALLLALPLLLFLWHCGGGVDGDLEDMEFFLTEGKLDEAIALGDATIAKLTANGDPRLRIFQRMTASALLARSILEVDENGVATTSLIGFMADWIGYKNKNGSTLQKILQVMPAGVDEHAADITRGRTLLKSADKTVTEVDSLGVTVLDDESRRAYQLLGVARLLEIGVAFYGPDLLCDCDNVPAPCANQGQPVAGGDGRPDGGTSVTANEVSQFDENVTTASNDFEEGGIGADFLSDLTGALDEMNDGISAIPGSRDNAVRTYIQTEQFATSINPSCQD